MTPRFTIAQIELGLWGVQETQLAATLMQAAAELELLPQQHYAKWGRPDDPYCARMVSDLMRSIEQLAGEWRAIASL